MKKYSKKERGFTLVELLIVIGIISVIAVLAVVQIDPEKQMEDARNRQRKAHVSSIYSEMQEYYARNKRTYPPCLDSGSTYINNCTTLTPDYFNSLPEDPSGQSDCYFVEVSQIQGVIVTAECAEGEEVIKKGQ